MRKHGNTFSGVGYTMPRVVPFDADLRRAADVLNAAIDAGITFFDTADMYGRGHNESLLSSFLRRHRDVRIASKFGIVRGDSVFDRRIENSPAYIADACDASLKRLRLNVIDLFYQHRVDPEVPIEDVAGAVGELVKEGKVKPIMQYGVNPNPELADVPTVFSLAKTEADRQAMLLMISRLEYGRPFFVPPDVPAARGDSPKVTWSSMTTQWEMRTSRILPRGTTISVPSSSALLRLS